MYFKNASGGNPTAGAIGLVTLAIQSLLETKNNREPGSSMYVEYIAIWAVCLGGVFFYDRSQQADSEKYIQSG